MFRGRRLFDRHLCLTATAATLVLAAVASIPVARLDAQAVPLDHYRLVPGFLHVETDDSGVPVGNGFGATNPWGAYTAYHLATNAKGQRTWRIENMLPNANGRTSQGSTMYLFEGTRQALLVDTAQNTQDIAGQTDLKTVVRHLLGHTDSGAAKASPVDFVVANTHSHGDHTGKNSLMSDRVVYYPDLDWPRNGAPANYVPVAEGGGPSARGTGQTVGQIDLGDRIITAINIHAHTPGSTGYFDRENAMVATGDAIGSAYVWAHFASVAQYADAVRHLRDVLRPLARVEVLPAHFYQVRQGARGKAPINGRPLDKQYVDDQVRVAEGILDGSLVGEPYRVVGRNATIATWDSAQTVYTLGRLYAEPAQVDRTKYHAVAIPGTPPATPDARYAAIDAIRSDLHLIRDHADESMYLLKGSTKALLIGTGTGTPGIAAFARRLAGSLPLSVAVTSDDPGQVGGLSQFTDAELLLPAGITAPGSGRRARTIGTGDVIDLGHDRGGRPLRLEVHALTGHSRTGVTLLDIANRVLFSGDALGTQGNDAGLVLREPLAAFAAALRVWRAQTDGKYDVVYTAHNYQWFTSPTYVDEVQQAVAKGMAEGVGALVPSTRLPGARMVRSSGAADVVASVVVE
jgi:glyoxylase-like metal-dependent hydrolase (beta-lactamase superfamily II)